MEWKVAPSYSNGTIIKVDEETKKALIEMPCGRCYGTGHYGPLSVFNGTCFECGGTGKVRKMVKVYTPKEYDAYLANTEKARERKVERKAAEKQYALDHSEENRKAELEKLGFDPENPQVYMIEGGNSYEIKDELKSQGFKFKPELGWYCAQLKEVPAPFFLVPIAFDEVFEWRPIPKTFMLKEDAAAKVKDVKIAALPESPSDFIGEIKERLRNLEVSLISQKDVESYYGISILYTFKSGENVLTWFCSGKGLPQDIHIGDTFLLTGTVKDHKEYNEIKQTHLSRCIIKER